MRVAVLFTCVLLPLAGQTKRALVVGIDHYQTREAEPARPTGANVAEKAAPRKPSGIARVAATGPSRGSWSNLEGAVADASSYRQILIDLYDVPPENIIFLTDKKAAATPAGVATAQRILDTI